MVILVIERIRKAYELHAHTKSLGLFTFVCRASWGAVKIKPHHPAIRNQWNQPAWSSSSRLLPVCFVAFVSGSHHSVIHRAKLSGRCRLNPTVQTCFAPYSCEIRTGAAPVLEPTDWSRRSVIVFLLYQTHTHTHTGQCWRGTRSRGLWSLCVYTEEQYVVISRSWRGILNPLLFNRIVHSII